MYPRRITLKLTLWLSVCLVAGSLVSTIPAAAQVATTAPAQCVQVGAPRCLRMASELTDAAQALMGTDVGPALLQNAADRRVQVRVSRLPRGLEGQYSPRTRTIVIDRRIARRAMQVQAITLAHELQHATERPDDDETSDQCFASEEAAFRVEARVWPQLWGGQLPADVDRYHREANELVRQLENDPDGFVRDVRDLYQDDCGDTAEAEEDE